MLELGWELQESCTSSYVSFAEEGRCGEFVERAEAEGFQSHGLKHDAPRMFSTFRELMEVLRKLDPAILIPHGYKANLLGMLAARRLGIPIVSVSHGWTGESLAVKLYERLDKLVLRWMDEVVCVSQGQAKKVRRVGVPKQKVRVICDAVRVERFDNPDSEYRSQLESLFPEKPEVIVGAAGRLSIEKGYRFLVDAAAEVVREQPHVGFVLFGDGPLRDDIAGRIESKGLADKFQLPGFTRDLDKFYPHFDLFVLPSFTEGLPNVVLEAFAAGVPVVATAVGGTPEAVEDGVNGYLVPPGEAEPLADRIARLASNPADRRAMGAEGRRRVEKEFSFASQAEAYCKLLAPLLSDETTTTASPLAVD